MPPSLLKSILILVLVPLLLSAASYGQSEVMTQNLARMRNRWADNPKDLESVYVYMTSAAQSPIEKGVVYQNIVSMFAQKGTRTYADDIAKYSEEVLKLPYRSSDLAQMYLDVGDGIIFDAPKGADGAAELKESDRTDVASWYLRALKILLDTISFDEKEAESPPGASPAAIKTTQDRNAMIARRDTCFTYLKDLYGNDPAELAKLGKLASHELGEAERGQQLLQAMRGEPVGPAKAIQTKLAQSSVPAPRAEAVPPAEASSGLNFGMIGVIAVVAAGGLFWFMKGRNRPA